MTIGGEIEPHGSGMVLDFDEFKKILEKTVGRFDHMHIGALPEGWTGNSSHIVSVPFEFTTAENLAKHWAGEVQFHLSQLGSAKFSTRKVLKVEVQESINNHAIWEV